MAEFPRLKTGAIAQYGLRAETRTGTQVFAFLDGSGQRYGLRRPQRSWTVELDLLDEGELTAVDDFAAQYFDTLESFSFTDPWSGTVYPACHIDGTEHSIRADAMARCSTSMTIVEEVS